MKEEIAVRVFISGQVQGVGYRFSTRNEAKRLGIQGWVRNLQDNRVEAVFQGSHQKVEEMITWCKRGPKAAIVDDVTVESIAVQSLEGFEIRY